MICLNKAKRSGDAGPCCRCDGTQGVRGCNTKGWRTGLREAVGYRDTPAYLAICPKKEQVSRGSRKSLYYFVEVGKVGFGQIFGNWCNGLEIGF